MTLDRELDRFVTDKPRGLCGGELLDVAIADPAIEEYHNGMALNGWRVVLKAALQRAVTRRRRRTPAPAARRGGRPIEARR